MDQELRAYSEPVMSHAVGELAGSRQMADVEYLLW